MRLYPYLSRELSRDEVFKDIMPGDVLRFSTTRNVRYPLLVISSEYSESHAGGWLCTLVSASDGLVQRVIYRSSVEWIER